nr:hypothetical protein [Tanacetum cinerariifolium]GEZ69605.1 hypothetical protein [Tanacetum cinerariifolium]
MLLCELVLRHDGHPFDPYAIYSRFPIVFSLEIHHGGELSKAQDRFYDGEKVHWFDQIDSDGFLVVEVSHMLACLGYVNPKMEYCFKMANKNALLPLSNDNDVLRFTKYVDRFKLMQLYVVHPVDKPEPLVDNENPKTEETFNLFFCDLDPDVGEPSEVPNVGEHNKVPNVGEPNEVPNVADQTEIPNDAEHSDGSEESDDSDDSDFDVDLKDRIEKVEVDMSDFRKYTNENVEWVEPNEVLVEDTQPVEAEVFEDLDLEDFDSASDPDDIDSNRKKALKMLARKHKLVDGNIYNDNFYCGQTFANKELIKRMVSRLAVENRRHMWLSKNDKIRVWAQCRGVVPTFSNDAESQFGPNGPSGSTGPSGKSKLEKTKMADSQSSSKPKVAGKDSQSCPWLLHCFKSKTDETWWVKRFHDEHTCMQSRFVNKCTAKFLSKTVEETIKPNPKIPIVALKDQLQKKFELGVLKSKVFKVKQMARDNVIGDYVNQYARRIYVCVGALKSGFKVGKRDIFGLDGCFMSGPYPITLTPPDYHTPVGRPTKKRKKSATELFDAPTVSQSQTFVRPTPPLRPTAPSIRQTAPFLRPTTPFVTPRFTKTTTNRLSPIKKPAGANSKGKNVQE